MNTQIIFEQYDNGIAINTKNLDGVLDPVKLVFKKHEAETGLGTAIMEDIANVMNKELCDKVRLTIKYEPINDSEHE